VSRGNEVANGVMLEYKPKSVPFHTDSLLTPRIGFSVTPIIRDLQLPSKQMEFRAKSRIATLLFLVVAATASALFAQSSESDKPQNHASVPSTREIVSLSIAATERSWEARDHLIYVERDEDRRLDSLGQVKSENVDVSRMILVNGARFERLVEHNGQLPSPAERRKNDEDFEKLKRETPAEQTARLRKDQENKSFLRDVQEAFDFQLIGEEIVVGRPAFVLQATPHPGYRGRGKYGKLLSKVEGKLWMDKQNFGWIKVDGQVTQSFSMGVFVARVQRGSQVVLEQTCVGDGVWVPKRLNLRANARILFLKSLDMERILTYSDYLPAADTPYSVSRER